jgi:hypothetical protein
VSQSSNQTPSAFQGASQVILLERGGELADFARLLDELGLPFVRCAQGLPDAEQLESARLVLASAQRLVESAPPHLSRWPITLAVVKDTSKTLSAHLHRIGVSMILCPPVHPQALRLLILHSIYRGPERRNRQRTPIGHPIRVGSGLFRHKATLLELSPGGARIEIARMPKIGSTLQIKLAKELTGARPLRLNTRVVRRIEKSGRAAGAKPEIGLTLLDASANKKSIEAILKRFADGPATWKSAPARPPTPAPRQGIVAELPNRPPVPRASPPIEPILDEALPIDSDPEFMPASGPSETLAAPPEADDSSERRSETRIPYNRRVVALDEEAARVLVGHDLSAGGMRVDSNPAVAVGDMLRVALHCGTQMEPIVVVAKALRDDGDEGLVLGFENLSPTQREHLEKIIASSGPIRTPHAEDSTEGDRADSLVVGELLETVRAADAATQSPRED